MQTIEHVIKYDAEIRAMAFNMAARSGWGAGSKEVADEWVQTAYLKIIKQQERRGNLNFMFYNEALNMGYIYKVLRSVLISEYRAKKDEVVGLVGALPDMAEGSELSEYQQGRVEAINKAIDDLPYFNRWVVRLYFFHGHSVRTLAAEAGVSHKWIWKVLNEGIRLIKNRFTDDR